VTVSVDNTARVWDAQTGQPLTEPLGHVKGRFSANLGGFRAQFSPDGKSIVTASVDGTASVWDLAPASAGCPGWLLDLATAVCGEVLNAHGVLEGTNQTQVLDQLRQTLEGQSSDDDWVVFGRWFLADHSTRTVSPFSKLGNDAVAPINAVSRKTSDVGLRTTHVPAQFVKIPPLGVGFAFHDQPVLLQGDGTLSLEDDFWPKSFWNERPRQPVHGQTKVVELAQMHIRADRSDLERLHQVLRLRLNDGLVAETDQGLVSGRCGPTLPGRTVFGVNGGRKVRRGSLG